MSCLRKANSLWFLGVNLDELYLLLSIDDQKLNMSKTFFSPLLFHILTNKSDTVDCPVRGKTKPVCVSCKENEGPRWAYDGSAGPSHLGCYRSSGCCCYWGSWRGQTPPHWCRPWDWGCRPETKTRCSLSPATCWSGCPTTSAAFLSGRRSSSCSVGPRPPRRPRSPPPHRRRSAAAVASDKGSRSRREGWPTRSPRRWTSSCPSCAPSACRRWRRSCPSWPGRTCWLSGCSGWTGCWAECLLAPSPSSLS